MSLLINAPRYRVNPHERNPVSLTGPLYLTAMAAFAPELLAGGAVRVRVRPSSRAARRMMAMMRVVMAAGVRVMVRYAALAVMHLRHAVLIVAAVMALMMHAAAMLALFRAFMAFVLVVFMMMRPAAMLALFGLAAVRMVAMVFSRAAVLAIASESRLHPADFTNRLGLFGFLLDFRIASGVFHLRLMQPTAAPPVMRLVTLVLGVVLRMMAAMVLTSLHFKGPPIRPALRRTCQ
jgi:hypothetical protein